MKVIDISNFRKKTNDQTPSILIIDDNENVCDVIRNEFKKHGYDIFVILESEALRQVIETKNIKVIIIDVNTPWINIDDLCRVLNRHESYKNIPIITTKSKDESFNINDLIESVTEIINDKDLG